MTINFPEDETWIVEALEARKQRYGSPYSVTIRRALVDYLCREEGLDPKKDRERLRSFSKVTAPVTSRARLSA